VELGQYLVTTGPRNLRVPVIPSGVQAAQIEVQNVALTFDEQFNVGGLSVSLNWRDGTNLATPLTAEFLGIPVLEPIADPGLSPTLTWSAVEDVTLYYVQIADPATGAPVWEGLTTETSITLPLELEADTFNLWFVEAYDSFGAVDILSLDPLALHASRWFDAQHYAKLQDLKSNSVNDWRGQLAQAFLTKQGHIPRTLPGPRAGLQDLLNTGFRFSQSQVTPFTTGD
jgi:hypothetical protein